MDDQDDRSKSGLIIYGLIPEYDLVNCWTKPDLSVEAKAYCQDPEIKSNTKNYLVKQLVKNLPINVYG